ncbi:MAG: type II toxin-antitoxin system Phd/YefM family antitoxin [Gammaproteobacteria bacterium]
MKIPAAEFKAKCLKLMDEVQETGEEIVITKRGRPIARLVAYRDADRPVHGYLAGTVHFQGDVIAPIGEAWDAGS